MMSDELIRLQQQFAIYRSEYAILLAGAKECEARAEDAERRVAELEAQLAAQAWRPVSTIDDEAPDEGIQVDLLVRGYLGDDGHWYYKDGDNPLRGWRSIDPPAPA